MQSHNCGVRLDCTDAVKYDFLFLKKKLIKWRLVLYYSMYGKRGESHVEEAEMVS